MQSAHIKPTSFTEGDTPGTVSLPRCLRTEGESHLKHSEDGCRKGIKVGRWSLIFEIKPRGERIQTVKRST